MAFYTNKYMEINKFTSHTGALSPSLSLTETFPMELGLGFWFLVHCKLLFARSLCAVCYVLCSGLLLFVDFNNYFMLSQFKKLW